MRKRTKTLLALCGFIIVGIISLDLFLHFRSLFQNFHPNSYNPFALPRIENINKYCDFINRGNNKMANASLEDIIITITFSKPLSVEEYEDYILRHDITASASEIRGLQPDGMRTTGGLTDWILEDMEEMGHEFIGVIGINGYVDSANLRGIMDDPLTYLADTSRDGYFGGIIRSKGAIRNWWTRSRSPAAIFNLNFAWALEDLKVAGYDYYQFTQ